MPLGTPLKTFVYDVGGGGMHGQPVKAVQTGGPSGGCIPHEMFDTPVDYETLGKLGSIMGSGGMVVMDEDNCMVDVARYFIEFTHSESCGKCTPCRVGLDKALRMLTRITKGEGREEDLDRAGRTGPHDPRHVAVRPGPVRARTRSSPRCAISATNSRTTSARSAAAPASARTWRLSPCENSCPLHMNIPRFLQLYKEGRLDDAFESVIMDNPLPASTGRVCQHPCDNRCRRQAVDEAVNMREVHRVIADSVLLSDRFDEMVGQHRRQAPARRPEARSPWPAPARPA